MIIINIAKSIVHFLDTIFNWLYGSRHNPLYRTGAILVSLLALMILTGFYLLFVYRLAAPYESMQTIQSDFFLGSWIRTLHRYASDLSVVFLILHILRMFSEGKTWGPRLLAWMTGVLLAAIMFIIGWTGFILVWDKNAQALALAGAEMLNHIPLFSDTIVRTFSGAAVVGTSFFFLNLFLHMALPLGMLFGLWLHVSNLKNPAWILRKRAFWILTIVLIIFSIVMPTPLKEQANLLELGGKYPLNIFYAHLVPMVKYFGSGTSFLVTIIGFFLLLLVPFYVKPKLLPEKSKHNQLACTGCEQCEKDCPFDAIEMVKRTQGTGSEFVASVIEKSCVGCGICSASCSQLAIGPTGKTSKEQIQWIKAIKQKDSSSQFLFIYCHCNQVGHAIEKTLIRQKFQFSSLPIECSGILHVSAVFYALQHYTGVYILGCAQHACQNRLGQELMLDRFTHGRDPAPPGSMDFKRVKALSGGMSEFDQILNEIDSFSKSLKLENPSVGKTQKSFLFLKQLISTAFFLSILSYLSAFPYQDTTDQAYLRISIRLPGQAEEICRDRTKEELEKLPMHMRTPKECKRTAVDYRLTLKIDETSLAEEIITAHGARGDKPLIVNKQIPLKPGQHHVQVEFQPTQETTSALKLSTDFTEEFLQDRAIMVYFEPNQKILTFSKTQIKN